MEKYIANYHGAQYQLRVKKGPSLCDDDSMPQGRVLKFATASAKLESSTPGDCFLLFVIDERCPFKNQDLLGKKRLKDHHFEAF